MRLRRVVCGFIGSAALLIGVATPASALLNNVSVNAPVNVECVNAVGAINTLQTCNTGGTGH